MNGFGRLVKKGSTVLGEFFADCLERQLSEAAVESEGSRELAVFLRAPGSPM
jgi:hypothetical protein